MKNYGPHSLKLLPGILSNFQFVRLYAGGTFDLTRESPPAQVVSACQGDPNLMIITSS